MPITRALSTLPAHAIHVAVIMDGNGRWAERRGLPRVAGHRAGAVATRRTVECACRHGVAALTLFAFSADNWRRPTLEVRALMALFAHHVRADTPRFVRAGVRLEVIGRRDRLPRELIEAIDHAHCETAHGTALHLRIAIDYSARAAITAGAVTPDVDLLIRTGGEQRLSDFLLWEAAYAELLFTNTMWPDFGEEEFASALCAYAGRERRFGGLAAQGSTP